MLYNQNKPPIVVNFNLTTYQREIETFPSDKNVGPVNDAITAIKKAKELWLEEFSEIDGKPYNPINGREIVVAYNHENEIWCVNGTLPRNHIGSVPHALIKKDGKVLAVFYK